MNPQPKEPPCPPGRKPHRERVKQIDAMLPEGKTGGICIDNTEEHKTWYLHELTKYPRLQIEYQCELNPDVYVIRVRKVLSLN